LNPESKDTNNNQGMNIDLLQTLSKNDSINVSQSYCHQETNENTNSSHKENEVSYSDVINKQTEETSCSFSPHNQHSYKDSNHIINELKLSKIFNSNSASSIQSLFG
jgi:outer membrane protein assembly factor BamA